MLRPDDMASLRLIVVRNEPETMWEVIDFIGQACEERSRGMTTTGEMVAWENAAEKVRTVASKVFLRT